MKNTLRVERAILNITQAELAEKVNVSRQSINAIEICRYVPNTILALKIARFFQKKAEDIFILEDTDWLFLLSNKYDEHTAVKLELC